MISDKEAFEDAKRCCALSGLKIKWDESDSRFKITNEENDLIGDFTTPQYAACFCNGYERATPSVSIELSPNAPPIAMNEIYMPLGLRKILVKFKD